MCNQKCIITSCKSKSAIARRDDPPQSLGTVLGLSVLSRPVQVNLWWHLHKESLLEVTWCLCRDPALRTTFVHADITSMASVQSQVSPENTETEADRKKARKKTFRAELKARRKAALAANSPSADTAVAQAFYAEESRVRNNKAKAKRKASIARRKAATANSPSAATKAAEAFYAEKKRVRNKKMNAKRNAKRQAYKKMNAKRKRQAAFARHRAGADAGAGLEIGARAPVAENVGTSGDNGGWTSGAENVNSTHDGGPEVASFVATADLEIGSEECAAAAENGGPDESAAGAPAWFGAKEGGAEESTATDAPVAEKNVDSTGTHAAASGLQDTDKGGADESAVAEQAGTGKRKRKATSNRGKSKRKRKATSMPDDDVLFC